jgi:hypothetical protein
VRDEDDEPFGSDVLLLERPKGPFQAQWLARFSDATLVASLSACSSMGPRSRLQSSIAQPSRLRRKPATA